VRPKEDIAYPLRRLLASDHAGPSTCDIFSGLKVPACLLVPDMLAVGSADLLRPLPPSLWCCVCGVHVRRLQKGDFLASVDNKTVNNVISRLRAGVEIRTHTRYLRTYPDSFVGAAPTHHRTRTRTRTRTRAHVGTWLRWLIAVIRR